MKYTAGQSVMIFVTAFTTGIVIAPNVTSGAECAGKSVVQCADALASKVDQLVKDNEALQKRLAKVEDDEKIRLENARKDFLSKLPGPADFYVKPIPPIVQHSEMQCDGTDILISAACTNSNGAQAAVGPKFFDRNGIRWASCDRYNTPRQTAEGQLICMKHH